MTGSVGAFADPKGLAGTWSGGPLVETVTVQSWVDECNARPRSGSRPGGTYRVSVVGDELAFSGPDSFRTDGCLDMGLARRVSHSATPAIRWWKTRCESPPGDPRKATITTVVRAVDDDTIVLSETAHYSSTVAAGTCAATVERSRTLKIVARDGAAPAASPSAKPEPSPPTPPPPSKASCQTPGEPATLEVKPRRKVLRPGEGVDLQARLLDRAGCETAGKILFRLAAESSALTTVTVDASGRVRVRAEAEPVEASIVVEGGGRSARVAIEVVSDQRYAELLAAGHDAGVDDEQALSIVLSGGGGAEAKTTVPVREETSARKGLAWMAIAGGVLALLALAAVALSRRTRGSGTPAAHDRLPEPVAAPPALAATACPTCGAAVPSGAEFCPNDGTRIAAAEKVASGGKICPVCGRKYERDASFCAKDGVELVPLN